MINFVREQAVQVARELEKKYMEPTTQEEEVDQLIKWLNALGEIKRSIIDILTKYHLEDKLFITPSINIMLTIDSNKALEEQLEPSLLNVHNKYKDKQLGVIIRDLREKAGISQTKLAKNIGVSPTYISLMENGKRVVNALTVQKIIDDGLSLTQDQHEFRT